MTQQLTVVPGQEQAMPESSKNTDVESRSLALVWRFDIVMGRVGRAALLMSFVGGLIWATASGEDYPLVLVLPLVTILAGRLVGAWLGGFVGHVAKYATGFMLAWLLVTLLLFYTRLDELPKILRDGESGGALLRPLRAVYLTDTWSLSLLVGFIGATVCEFGLVLLAVVTLCVRRAFRISPASLQPSDPGRWYQLSLKTVLLLVLTCSVGMGWFATRSNRARANRDRVGNVDDAVAAIEKLGGRVASSRDDERDPTWLEELFGDPGNPDDPTVVIEVHWVSLENMDALELVSELDDLKMLAIEKSDLTDDHLQQIGEMTGLEILHLIDVHVAHLNALSSIQTLELSSVHIKGSGPEHLPGLESLSELALGETTGFFEHVGEMPSLRSIKLYHSGVDTTLKRLHRLAALREVDLRGSDVTDEGLRHLTRLTDLEELWLGFTGISDSGLIHVSNMTKLKYLSLIRTKVSDRGMSHLRGLTRLKVLDLSYTDIGDGGLEHLQGHTTLEDLNLSHTQITNAGLAYLKGMDRLDSLDLFRTQITNAGLAHLERMVRLGSLNLSHTPITNAGLAYLAGMSSLQSLNLRGTKIDDAGLKHLTGLTNLLELDVYETDITDAGEADLKEALPDCIIR